MTVSALPKSPATCVLQPGEVLTATCDAISSGRVGRLADSNGARVPDVPISFAALAAGKTLTFGPYPQQTRHLIEAMVGSVAWSQAQGSGSHVEIVGDASDVREIFGTGAPVDYTDGDPVATGQDVAGKGSRYTDKTIGRVYTNTGTATAPAWTPIGITISGASADTLEMFGAGAPVNYTDGTPPATGETIAGPGSRYTDITGAKLYLNTGTKAQPTWTQLAPVA